MPGTVLIVDDDPDTCALFAANLNSNGYTTTTRASVQDALALLETQRFDAIITDVHLEGMTGLDLCTRVSESYPDTPVIVMTGQASMEVAILALRAGAQDFVTKPLDLAPLLHRLRKAMRQTELEVEVRRLQRSMDREGASTMIGESRPIKRVRALVERAAASDVPVLITGESGVGKELVARELHMQGSRPDGAFVAVNCAAMPSQLLESELFGHVRGAFTDAKQSRDGLFLRANGGTLFLDEIGELPLDMQPKLLRALQERKVRPVGGDQVVGFDARIITASNRDLESEVQEGGFREDLFYRINVINIHVPPLRARGPDILLLAQHFLGQIAERNKDDTRRMSSAAAEKMLSYDWPGNVRELENAMERAVALSRYEEITVADLPDKLTRYQRGEMVIASDDLNELPTLDALERRYIRKVLSAVKGNKTQAAEVLGIARRTLYRWLDRLEADDTAVIAPRQSV